LEEEIPGIVVALDEETEEEEGGGLAEEERISDILQRSETKGNEYLDLLCM
jgi:hypothetical protein